MLEETVDRALVLQAQSSANAILLFPGLEIAVRVLQTRIQGHCQTCFGNSLERSGNYDQRIREESRIAEVQSCRSIGSISSNAQLPAGAFAATSFVESS